MTLKELELFYLLCENPHVSQLSRKLELSQSAISLAIKSLEKKLEEPLFDRLGKKLVLNERGRIFKEKTYESFLSLRDAENFFKEAKISGILNIASSKTIGNFILPQIIFDYLSMYKNIGINKEIINSARIMQMVKDGQLDMGFIEIICKDEDIIKEILCEDDLIVVSCDESLSNELYLDELFSKKWILREKGSGTRDVFLREIADVTRDLDVFMEYSDFEEIKMLLESNPEIITCISKVAVLKELKAKQLKEIKLKNITIKRNFYCIYHRQKYQSKLFDSFKIFVANRFKSL
ncbi:MAG: LysR family transcriptional regulator [Arcobacter sp.]|nr:MAG: LysR family transcriptional regulator [Arcobacter sp.]